MKQWHIIAIVAGITAIASIIISVGVIRLCVGSDESMPLSPRSFICGGNLNAARTGFKLLGTEDIFITSDIPESKQYSLDRGNDAAKLIDGDKRTLAAPGNRQLDYRLRFTGPHRMRQLIITWEDYGTIEKYISKWKLEASEDGIAWKIIESGDSPHGKETIINRTFNATFLRITAESREEWIGIYELELVGRPL